MNQHVYRPIWLALLAVFTFACSTTGFAQSDTGKKSLDHSDYDKWNTVSGERLSNDGKWISYSIRSGKDDAESTLHVRKNGSTTQYTIVRASGPRFTYDSKYLIYRVTPDKERVKQLKKANAKPDELPGTNLEVLNLETGEKFSDTRVKSFRLPEKNGTWLAYLLDKPLDNGSSKQGKTDINESYEITPEGLKQPESKTKLKKRRTKEELVPKKPKVKSKEKPESKEEKKSEEAKKKPTDKKKDVGTTLVLKNLDTGAQRSFQNVMRFDFSKQGERLAFVTSVKKEKSKKNDESTKPSDGVHVIDLATLETKQIVSGEGEYKSLVFNENGSELAFLSNRDDYASKTTSWSIYHWNAKQKEAALIAEEASAGIPEQWWIYPSTTPSFTEDGKRITFATAPVPEEVRKERKSDKENKEDEKAKAKLDLWHWQDPYLQPQQLLQVAQEKRRSYTAVYNIKTKKLFQLANPDIPSVRIDRRSKSNLAAASTNMRYRKSLSWDIQGYQDTYLFNLDSGEMELLFEKSKARGQLSPEGKFVTWYDPEKRQYYAISTGKDRDIVEISKGIEFPLFDELHDTPSLPRPYGSAGWTANDEAVLIYDRFDVWKLDPTGKTKPVCITNGFGRENQIRLRGARLDLEARNIDLGQPVVLSAFNEKTKASGYYRMEMAAEKEDSKTESDQAKLTQLIMLDERVNGLSKAKDSNEVLLRRSTFQMYPDIWASTMDFKKMHRISRANPQQKEYSWGTAELVHWDATDGQKLDGILYKPEGFDPKQKYPMMVYFYERNSDNLHSYYVPAAGRSIINHSFYVSRGYLVFVPDIPYKTGEPGPSAANAILPGVKSLVDQGFVKEDKIGMQGHSWGGYQTAYLVTQTDMFACAESGAPVSNMTSAYGGIRWSSGMSRMFQYEQTQSRIGDDLWSAREKYIANSPVFFADKINTPLLILHNDKDGAVPWYQGIELFVALRRLEKPAWLLNYNGDPHWVMGNANRRDFAIRMQQFFDHYLMDAPEPEWMAYGIPAVDKGKEYGLDLLEEPTAEEGEAKTSEEGSDK